MINETAKALLAMFPLTITMAELNVLDNQTGDNKQERFLGGKASYVDVQNFLSFA
jgi:hypothetical protein